MGGDDYAHDNAAIHPLYRLAGVNLDFKKLFRLGVCGLRDEALRLSKETQEPEKRILRGRSFCAGIPSPGNGAVYNGGKAFGWTGK